MNDNYLWDRSGEPDAEIRELEELLGTLKYQPRPLQIPATVRAAGKRTFIPLAIAAAIAPMMIAAGLWIHFASSPARPPIQAPIQVRENRSAPNPNQTAGPLSQDEVAISKPPAGSVNGIRKVNLRPVARNDRRHIPSTAPRLTEQELAEKDQVLIALRLASAKLNLAQRKTQTLPQVNPIRN
jgi:hypothetical protein